MNRYRALPVASAVLPFLLALTPTSDAQSPQGVPVPELAEVDQVVQNLMTLWGISAGAVGIMRDGVIIYQRGFGVTENTPMRLASVEKPVTAAAIHTLVAEGALDLDDNVFDLGQQGGGILSITPFGGTPGSPFLELITVQNLLDHRGGWDRDIAGDPMFMAVEIAGDMGVPSPPTREQTARYWMAEPLERLPGLTEVYSNFGYMLLGLIVEEVSGQSLLSYVRENILVCDEWNPSTETYRGRSLLENQDPREPPYVGRGNCQNVFNPTGLTVPCAYGGWNLEGMVGHGNLVSSVAPLLRFLDTYTVVGDDIGMPHDGSPDNGSHTGSLDGTSTIASQRDDGLRLVVLYNRRASGTGFAAQTRTQIYQVLDGITSWPTEAVDGFWVDFDSTAPPIMGAYDRPFRNLDEVIRDTTDGTKLRLMPGSSGPWSGVLSRKMQIDAPFGPSVIGQ